MLAFQHTVCCIIIDLILVNFHSATAAATLEGTFWCARFFFAKSINFYKATRAKFFFFEALSNKNGPKSRTIRNYL